MKPLNGHQFSQGNFGSLEPTMNVKPTDEHRYPRGYTPERYHEVADALPAEQFSASPTRVTPSGYGDPTAAFDTSHDRAQSQSPLEHSSKWHSRAMRAAAAPFRARVVDTVARSTVPVENLGATHVPQQIPTLSDDLKQGWGEGDKADVLQAPSFRLDPPSGRLSGSHSVSWAGDTVEGAQRYRAEIKLNPSANGDDRHNDRTLIHELGHHNSNANVTSHSMLRGVQRDEYKQPPAMMGKEEGFADRYASEHLVRRRGEDPNVEKDHPYPASTYGFTGRDAATFDNNYGNTHWMKPDAEGVTPYDRAHGAAKGPSAIDAGARAATDAPSTPHLWQRDAEQAVTQRVPDHGQYPINTPDGNPLDTIKVGRGVPAEVQERTEHMTEVWRRARGGREFNGLGSPYAYEGGPEQHDSDFADMRQNVPSYGELQAARGEKYLQKLKDKGYTDFAKRGQVTPHNEFVEKARAAHPWPQS